jgi:hypothetical protein
VPSFWITWRPAALLAVGLAAVAVSTLRSGRQSLRAVGGVAREAAIVFGLFSLWQRAAELSITRVTGAIGHARWVWHAERVLHLPSEVTVQHALLPYPLLVKVSNLYYAGLHFPVTIAFLVWLYVRHRERYPLVRNTIAVATGACLLVQMIPVAPPRMLAGLGFVDTGVQYGQSVYGSVGRGIADQLSAMPSVHVAWAVLVGVAVVGVSISRWRWVVVVHPIVTMLVVVVTANHFWLDGIVAVLLLGLGWIVATRVPVVVRSVEVRSTAGTREPELPRRLAQRPARLVTEHRERPVRVGNHVRERSVVGLRPVGPPLEPAGPERAREGVDEVARVATPVARVVERDGRHLEVHVGEAREVEQRPGGRVGRSSREVGEAAVVEGDGRVRKAFEQSG